jgi:hypothetical protein
MVVGSSLVPAEGMADELAAMDPPADGEVAGGADPDAVDAPDASPAGAPGEPAGAAHEAIPPARTIATIATRGRMDRG